VDIFKENREYAQISTVIQRWDLTLTASIWYLLKTQEGTLFFFTEKGVISE